MSPPLADFDTTAPLAKLRTMDLLRSLGFVDGKSDIGFAVLKLAIGPHVIEAQEWLNRYFVQVVHLGGVISTGRVIAMIDSEVLPEMDSHEQAIALVSHLLLQHERELEPFLPAWVRHGRQHWHLLPWEIARRQREAEAAIYEARPKCMARREWVRVAIKMLAEQLPQAEADQDVWFTFDGKAMSIDMGLGLIAFSATGIRWEAPVAVRAIDLAGALPKRLSLPEICISVWRGRLQLDRHVYPILSGGETSQ